MFKTVIAYRIAPTWMNSVEAIESGLNTARYLECGASQEKSIGWTEPRGEANGPLVETIGGQYILKLKIESKAVPADIIKRKYDEYVVKVEAETGRKPGKKESKEIKEDLKLSLLPMAFTKLGAVLVWIDPMARLLVIGAGSQAKADDVVTHLVKCLDGFGVLPITTNLSTTAAMSEWLVSQAPPEHFSVDRECELKSSDETKAVVRYSRHALEIDEIKQHISSGKVPTKLALTWDGRVSFVMTDSMFIKKIAFLDGVFDGTSQEKEDGFDADVAISTGELRKMLPDLISALGGEQASHAESPAA